MTHSQKRSGGFVKYASFFLSALFAIMLSILDEAISRHLSLIIFYCVPVFVTAWINGLWASLFIVWLSVMGWFVSDVVSVRELYYLPIFFYFNLLARVTFLAGFAGIIVYLKKTLLRLEEANKDLTVFVCSSAHDLSAPLRVINGLIGFILRSGNIRSEDADRLKMINKAALGMSELLKELLLFAKSGTQPLKMENVDMGELARQASGEVEAAYGQGREIKFNIGDCPAVTGDRILLKQVLFNIISNAVKYTRIRDVAMIEMGCDGSRDEALFHIKDNGIGFNMNSAKNLFLEIRRLHKVEEYEGSGLGLLIVRRILDRHDGRVWIDSKEGDGTTVFFTLKKAGIFNRRKFSIKRSFAK